MHNAPVSFPSCIRSNIFIVSCKGMYEARAGPNSQSCPSLRSHTHTPSVTQINHLTYVCRKLPWIYGNSCGNKWLVRYTLPSCCLQMSSILNLCSFIRIGCLKRMFFRHASVHETDNLHARRWRPELLWALVTRVSYPAWCFRACLAIKY